MRGFLLIMYIVCDPEGADSFCLALEELLVFVNTCIKLTGHTVLKQYVWIQLASKYYIQHISDGQAETNSKKAFHLWPWYRWELQ